MSMQRRRKFKELHFDGGRFNEAQGFLDFDVLKEFEVYRNILIETAKKVWRAQHPGRRNLPAGFEERFRLGISAVDVGSCKVLVERIDTPQDDQIPMDFGDELDNAGKLVDETLLAVENGTQLPNEIPPSALLMFGDWGSTLSDSESINLQGRNGQSPKFNSIIRKYLHDRLAKSENYNDVFDSTGEIRAAALRSTEGGSFKIRLESGDLVDGVFNDQQESDIIAAFHDHKSFRIRLKGEAEYSSVGELLRISRVDWYDLIPTNEFPFDPDAPPILEVFQAIHKSLPDDAWDALPTDGAKNYKHYLYGWAKDHET